MLRLGLARSLLSHGCGTRLTRSQCRTLVLGTVGDRRNNSLDVLPKRVLLPSYKLSVRFSHLSAIIDRGAYDERFHTTGSDVKSLEVVSEGKHVVITWGDGKTSRFHSLWLRSTCFCPRCRLDSTGQSCVDYDTVPEDSRIASATDDGNGCLVVQWKEDPDHTGLFPLKYLKAHCYSKQSLEAKRRQRNMTFTTDPQIPRISYQDVAGGRNGVYRWVQALNEPGIAIVEDVPCEEDMILKMCQKIADLTQHTIYGETFNVKADARPINAAYSAGELPLHMDQTQYESPPGIQALHCLKFDEKITGGDSLFVDVFHVAETFREKHPEEFQILCEVPLTYETVHYKRDWPVHMRYKRPMLTLNDHGDLVGVKWHPQLAGPLQVEEELVEPFFHAYKKFYSLTTHFPYMYRHRLRPGELVSFNNRRVLHGRAAFDKQVGERYLRGCYLEISEFKSCVEVLCNLEGGGRPVVRVGDLDWQ